MNNVKGFSLVELMVAVGIVGVMSSVAVPRYQKYKVEASRSEAKASLSTMYTLQQLYYTDNDRYGTLDEAAATSSNGVINIDRGVANEIEFPLSVDQKYNYLATPSGDDKTEFKAIAKSWKVLGSCVGSTKEGNANAKKNKDKWCMNHNKELANDGKKTPSPCEAGDSKYGGCNEKVTVKTD